MSVEESEPTYRLSFWSVGGTRCRQYDLTGAADVGEVNEWADSNVEPGETYILGINYEICLPDMALAMIRRWISDVPSKIV